MQPPPPSSDDVLALLMPLWRSALGTEVNAETDFLAHGGSSLSAMSIADAVARRYPQREGLALVALQTTFEARTLREAADALAAFLHA
jgi:hypothetical protein